MRAGFVFLVLAYVLSQFYRTFLAVMSPVLGSELGATPAQLSQATAWWFMTFAGMQLVVGWALDRVGPRRTASALLGLGGAGGAVVFATAGGPGQVQLAMVMIGIGCSPVLMASYYIFARIYPPRVFATLAGALIGVGTLGNIFGSAPLAMAVEAIGWRETMWLLAALTLIVAVALSFLIQDPSAVEGGEGGGSFLDLLRMPALWLLFPLMFVQYAPAAGIRGLWAGPYLAEVHGLDATGIGQVTLAMGLAMVAGSFAYGPLDRVFGTRKWVVMVGNLCGAAACLVLWQNAAGPLWLATVLFVLVGFFGASFAVMMAHGRSFYPPHLVGRGVSLMNLFGMGGVGVLQAVTGGVYVRTAAAGGPPDAPYATLFLFYGVLILGGCAIYLFAREDRASFADAGR